MPITQNIENNHIIPLYKKRDITLVRGEGVYVYDENGKKYLDFSSQFGVAAIGHNNSELNKAIASQADQIISVHNSFYCEPRAHLTEKLLELLPNELSQISYFSTGTECVEVALKFARVATGRSKIISTKGSYHGRTMGALTATGQPKYQKGFSPLVPDFIHVPFNNLSALEDEMSDEIAAVILEPIQAESGVRMPDADYLKNVKKLCQKHGALLICDEVQVGTFRTGAFLATGQYNVVPDIVCLSKAIGGGMPLGVVAITQEIAERLPKGAHGTTFGGNAICCTAGLTTLNYITDNQLNKNISEMGEYLLNRLKELQQKTTHIREVRGNGLIIAIEFKEKVGKIMKELQEGGVLVISSGSTILRILPPYIITKENCDEFLDVLEEVII